MATLTVAIEYDERYPDFDISIVDKYTWSNARLLEVDEKLYMEFKEICNKYDEVQDKLSKLYAQASKKTNS